MSSRILPALAIMIAVGIVFGYIRPVWGGPVADAKEAIGNANKALASASAYKTRENELASIRDSIDQTSLARLETFLPDSVDNVGIILDINALAARSGLLLSNVDVAANTVGSSQASAATNGAPSLVSVNPIGSVDLSLSAVGTYAALQAFLVGIEKSARLLDVRDIVVTGSETGVYSYRMTMRLYWLR